MINDHKAASVILKSMANENRLKVLCCLLAGEMSVGELEKIIGGISQSALSQHLARMRRDNIVEYRREQQKIFYSISSGRVLVLLNALAKSEGK